MKHTYLPDSIHQWNNMVNILPQLDLTQIFLLCTLAVIHYYSDIALSKIMNHPPPPPV